MKPLLHAKISAKRFGGLPSDYITIHDFFDSTKEHIADSRHRLFLHNSFGIFLAEKVFGTMIQNKNGEWVKMPYITNSDGKQISIRDIAEQHVIDDLGHIPSLSDCAKFVVNIDAELSGGLLASSIRSGNYVIVD